MPLRNYTNTDICDETMRCEKQSEPSMGCILEKTMALVQDIHRTASCIRGTLFGERDLGPMPSKREVTCTRDAMEALLEELMDIHDELSYVANNL